MLGADADRGGRARGPGRVVGRLAHGGVLPRPSKVLLVCDLKYRVQCTNTLYVGGQPIRSLFTPFDARADIILYPCRSPHGGRLKDPMTWLHAHGPCACSRQGPSISAQGVLKWEGQRSRRAATRATAAPRPERINKAFDFVAWKGGVACSEAVQTMGAWLARCGRVPVQRAARCHATVSASPIREELGR